MDDLLNLDDDMGEMDEKIDIGLEGDVDIHDNDDIDDNGNKDANRGSADIDDTDEDDDSDFLALQQKLLIRGSNTTSSTNQQEEEQGVDSDDHEDSILTQPQNQQGEQNTSDSKSPIAPSVDELKQRIDALETELSSLSDSPRFLQKIQGLETTNRRLLDENSQLQQRIHHLEQQNQRLVEKESLDQPIVSFKIRDTSHKSRLEGESTMDDKDVMIQELESLVQNLQQRMMGLVEEKLQLKLDLDRMEHEIKYYQQLHPNTPSFVAQTREAWLAIMNKESKEGVEGEENEEDDPNHPTIPATQKDFLKIAMENKKKRETPGLGFHFLIKGSSVSNPTSTAKDATSHQSLNDDSHPSDHDDIEPQSKSPDDDNVAQEDTPLDMKSSLAKNVSGFVSLFAPKKPNVKEDDEKIKSLDSDTVNDDTESAKNQDDSVAEEDVLPLDTVKSSSSLVKNVSGFASLFGSKKTDVKEEEGKASLLDSDDGGNQETEPSKNHNDDDLADKDTPMEMNKSKLGKAGVSGFASLFGSKKTNAKDEDGNMTSASIESDVSNDGKEPPKDQDDQSKSAKAGVSGFASLFGSKKTNVKDEDGKLNTHSVELDPTNDSKEPPQDQDDSLPKNEPPVDMKSAIAKNVSGLASLFGSKKTDIKPPDEDGSVQSWPGQQEDPAVSSAVVMESMMLLASDSPTNSIADVLDEMIDFGEDDDSETESALFAVSSQGVKKQGPGTM